jgi:putative flavoprotein involved in K+ transport
VVGGGQAGLAAGYHLARSGLRFTILDSNHEIGAAWERRWDTLRLFTPARYNALPGLKFPGARYALPGKSEVAAYLRRYARTFSLPIQRGVTVTALHRDACRFVAETGDGRSLTASSVIVATGANQRPHIPAFASSISPAIVQLHSSDYRRPAQVPEGKVLVVGAGNSGAQIAVELAAAGRTVLLSGRDTGLLPRRPLMRPSVDSVRGRRLMHGRLFAGDPLVGMAPRALQRPGLSRVGRTLSALDGFPVLEAYGVARDIRAMVWCTGFRPDFGWIELPVLGLDGYPAHRRGIATEVPGLAFVGLRFQHRMGSALLGGVGEDAAYVVEHISTYVRETKSFRSVLSPRRELVL